MELFEKDDFEKRTRMKRFDVALESLMGRLDCDSKHAESQLSVARTFKEIAGEAVSEHVVSIIFRDGVATVVMDSGIWAQELVFLAEDYREKINEKLGADIVTAVLFRTRPMR